MDKTNVKEHQGSRKLYKCELSSDIRGLENKTEYLRCKSTKILEKMFVECFNFKHSMYWGYSKVKITSIKLSNFPEVMTIKMKCK